MITFVGTALTFPSFLSVYLGKLADCKVILETVQQFPAEQNQGFATWWHLMSPESKLLHSYVTLAKLFHTCPPCCVEHV